jgi:hypothetical protein
MGKNTPDVCVSLWAFQNKLIPSPQDLSLTQLCLRQVQDVAN